MFDTGSMLSIFSSDAANDLKLRFPEESPEWDKVTYADGRGITYYYYQFHIYIHTPTWNFLIPVRFPVVIDKVDGCRWIDSITNGENIIGMKGFVTNNMLCFTQDTLYILGLSSHV
jgi:hypothetical protein